MTKLKFEGLCPHCKKKIELIRELPEDILAQIRSPVKEKASGKPKQETEPTEQEQRIADLNSSLESNFGTEANGIEWLKGFIKEKGWLVKSRTELTKEQIDEIHVAMEEARKAL